jgi:hypothetical protein
MDDEALIVARGRSGPHKAALANLDPIIRELVAEVRVSGRAFVSCGGSGSSNCNQKRLTLCLPDVLYLDTLEGFPTKFRASGL